MQFEEEFVQRCTPVVISGVAEGWGSAWGCPSDWEDTLRGVWFRVGSDDRSDPVMMRAESFMKYVREEAPHDDNPLYLFQHLGDDMTLRDPAKSGQLRVHNNERHQAMAQDYQVPLFFQEDVFRCAGNAKPPYRSRAHLHIS